MTYSPGDTASSSVALVLGGGGARTAYQAGVLRYLGEIAAGGMPIITGVGAGALNAFLLAGQERSWPEATRGLVEAWTAMHPARVFEPRSLWDLVGQLVRHAPSPQQSLLDPAPLRDHLTDQLPTGPDGSLVGVQENIDEGWLEALALTTTHYGSLRTVTWTQGRSPVVKGHERWGYRETTLTIDHVMAAMALALLYPAVSIGGEWHGAGAGLLRPLAPALHLGADRVVALSTRAEGPGGGETEEESYPSPLQVASILSNTLLQDTLDADATRLDRVERFTQNGPPGGREKFAPPDVLVLRPSVDLTDVAERLNVEIGAALGTVLQYLHGEGTRLPDLLSMLLFEPDYLRRLLLLGYHDARRQHDRLASLFGD